MLSFSVCLNDRRICRHLHIAIQSGSAANLKRMGRRITPSEFHDVAGPGPSN
jgi:tRNA A37 methylthiotransferase MiaB